MPQRVADSSGVFRSNGEARRLVEGMIEGLLELESGLTDWELNFVEDIAEKFVKYGALTDNQMAKLMQIYDEKV